MLSREEKIALKIEAGRIGFEDPRAVELSMKMSKLFNGLPESVVTNALFLHSAFIATNENRDIFPEAKDAT